MLEKMDILKISANTAMILVGVCIISVSISALIPSGENKEKFSRRRR